jgi:hypothetical protein
MDDKRYRAPNADLAFGEGPGVRLGRGIRFFFDTRNEYPNNEYPNNEYRITNTQLPIPNPPTQSPITNQPSKIRKNRVVPAPVFGIMGLLYPK